jgi:hypothetical protein
MVYAFSLVNEWCVSSPLGLQSAFPKTLRRKAAVNPLRVKYWKTIADNLSKSGWNCGCISSTDYNSQQFWVADAERIDAGCFIVHADEKLTAFLELLHVPQALRRRKSSRGDV